MGRPSKTNFSWEPQAAELMVAEGISLKEAISQLQVPLTTDECQTIQRRKSFRDLLRAARTRLHNEIGSDPSRNKEALIGQLQLQADNLEASGEYDKAAEVLFKIAKVKNYLGDEQTVNVFAGLTAKDFDAIRKRLSEAKPTESKEVN
jgi:hypothetical protein